MNYHNTTNPGNFIALENKHWMPFIKTLMDKKQTSQLGWGNAIVLSPSGDNIKFNTVSYYLFSTLQDALMPHWDPQIEYPNMAFDLLDHLRKNISNRIVYRIIKMVSKN